MELKSPFWVALSKISVSLALSAESMALYNEEKWPKVCSYLHPPITCTYICFTECSFFISTCPRHSYVKLILRAMPAKDVRRAEPRRQSEMAKAQIYSSNQNKLIKAWSWRIDGLLHAWSWLAWAAPKRNTKSHCIAFSTSAGMNTEEKLNLTSPMEQTGYRHVQFTVKPVFHVQAIK